MTYKNRNEYYEALKNAHEEKLRRQEEEVKNSQNRMPQEIWVEKAQKEFDKQFEIACIKGIDPKNFQARIVNIVGSENIKAIATHFSKQGFYLMLTNTTMQTIIAYDLNAWLTNFPKFCSESAELRENWSYTINVFFKKKYQ